MSKKRKNRSKRSKRSKWTPPENYKNYFYASSDDEFKAKHPVGYWFLVALGLFAFIFPGILFCLIVGSRYDSGWIILGLAGGLVCGVGLFNYVAIIIDQYLGHLVSLISFLVGGIMMLASWLLCQ